MPGLRLSRDMESKRAQPRRTDRPLWHYLLIALFIMAIAASIEVAMGRRPISPSGRIRLWAGDVSSSENSQQIADWYSFTHIIHGFIFYAVLRRLAGRSRPIGPRLVAAVAVESAWEVLENSNFVINRYRQTMAQGYYGDSILNSMSDILFMVLGFYLARRLPVWMTISLVVIIEAGLAWWIRDSLTLNIIMLIHPFRAIKHWQSSA